MKRVLYNKKQTNSWSMTYNEWYDVIRQIEDCYVVRNDHGEVRKYWKSHFITDIEYRNIKLEDILKA
jgi:hypothetical protein